MSSDYGQEPYGRNPYGQDPAAGNPYAAWDPDPTPHEYYSHYPQQYPPQYAPVAVDHPRAQMTMIFGILGVCGAFLGPLAIFGPVALFLAIGARKEVQADPARYRSGGSLSAGFVMGIIGTVMLALWVVGMIAYFVLFAAMLGVSRY